MGARNRICPAIRVVLRPADRARHEAVDRYRRCRARAVVSHASGGGAPHRGGFVDERHCRGNHGRPVDRRHGGFPKQEGLERSTFGKQEKQLMKINSFLKLKHVAWASGALVAAILVNVVTRSGAKASVQAPSAPVVQVAAVEEKDVPVYGEWIGTLTGQVNADVKAQVTGYLLKRSYEEGSYVRKGQLLFEIDPRPLQAALDQAKGQLDQAQAQLIQDEAQLATAEANQLKSQLDFEKYAPLAKVDAVSQQDLDNANQTNLANKAQVKVAEPRGLRLPRRPRGRFLNAFN